MVIYEDHAHCFGCGYRVSLSALGRMDIMPAKPKPPENLEETLAYIATLPLTDIRGLKLPADSEGYYLVWPDGKYYKKRRYFADDGRKYHCPRGHKKPLYVPWAPKGATTTVLVEGELNALSLAQLQPPRAAVASPGGVGDFGEKVLDMCNTRHLTSQYWVLILDKDGPGLDAAIRMKGLLMQRFQTPYVAVKLLERDANELLVSGTLQAEAKSWGVGL